MKSLLMLTSVGDYFTYDDSGVVYEIKRKTAEDGIYCDTAYVKDRARGTRRFKGTLAVTKISQPKHGKMVKVYDLQLKDIVFLRGELYRVYDKYKDKVFVELYGDTGMRLRLEMGDMVELRERAGKDVVGKTLQAIGTLKVGECFKRVEYSDCYIVLANGPVTYYQGECRETYQTDNLGMGIESIPQGTFLDAEKARKEKMDLEKRVMTVPDCEFDSK